MYVVKRILFHELIEVMEKNPENHSPKGAAMATPLRLSESEVTPFNFYSDASIYEGMICSAGAYKLSASFDLDQQSEAFKLARKLAKASKVVLTTGEINHRIWVKLGSIIH